MLSVRNTALLGLLSAAIFCVSCQKPYESKLGPPTLNPSFPAFASSNETTSKPVLPQQKATRETKVPQQTVVVANDNSQVPFKYPDELIPMPKNRATEIEPKTDLPANPPLDLGCENAEIPDFMAAIFKTTFDEAFEASRKSYIKKVSKTIAKLRNINDDDHPIYDLNIKYAVNKLKTKKGYNTWEVVFFSNYKAIYFSGPYHMVGKVRITSYKPCQYTFGTGTNETSEDYISNPFSGETPFLFDYTPDKKN